MTLTKFKIKDTVRCIDGGRQGGGWELDLVFTIEKITNQGSSSIYWSTQRGNGVYEDSLELDINFKVGDKVEIIDRKQYIGKRGKIVSRFKIDSYDAWNVELDGNIETIACFEKHLKKIPLEKKFLPINNPGELQVGDRVKVSIPRNKDNWKYDGFTGIINEIRQMKNDVHFPIIVVFNDAPKNMLGRLCFTEEEVERI